MHFPFFTTFEYIDRMIIIAYVLEFLKPLTYFNIWKISESLSSITSYKTLVELVKSYKNFYLYYLQKHISGNLLGYIQYNTEIRK